MAIGSFGGGGLGMGIAFSLEDRFSANADKINTKMDKLGMKSDRLTKRMDTGKSLARVGAGIAGAGALILAPFVAGLGAASDLEENINKTEVAFGVYADSVKKFSESSLDNFGIDKIAALDMASLFGDMSTGMGIGQEQAMGMSKTLVGLAGDLSSFKNISIERSQTALKGIFTGEGEALKGLGIIMNQVNLDAFLAQKGINKTFKEMSQQEKVMTRMDFVMAKSKNALGDFARTSDGFANSQRVAKGTVKEMSASLGSILLPIAAKAFQLFSVFGKMFVAFSKTTVGKTVLIAVAAFGAFLLVGGLLITVIGGIQMAIVAVTVAAASSPLLPIMLAVVALAAVIYVVVKAVKNFTGKLENMKTTGIVGFFTRLVAIVKSVAELWSNWDGKNTGISEGLKAKLEKLGLLSFVLKLSTWIVRIKEFFKSLGAGFMEGIALIRYALTSIWSAIQPIVTPILAWFSSIGGGFTSIESKMDKWKNAGRIVGLVIIGILAAIAINFVIMGIAAIAALWPIILVVGILIAAIWGGIWVFNNFGLIVDTVLSGIAAGWEWLKSVVVDWVVWFFQLPAMMAQWGINFVTAIIQGIGTMWGQLIAWLTEKVKSMVDIISNPVGAVMDFLGVGGDGNAKDTGTAKKSPQGKSRYQKIQAADVFSTHHTRTTKSPQIVTQSTNGGGSTPQPIILQNYMDGEKVSELMMNKQELKTARE